MLPDHFLAPEPQPRSLDGVRFYVDEDVMANPSGPWWLNVLPSGVAAREYRS